MTRNYKYILFFFLCFLFSDEDIGSSEESTIKNDIITILATANVKGEVDPCG